MGRKMNTSDREILDHFVRTRKKTIELFSKVLDEWLSRKPDGEDMSLSWLFMHIADGPNWWMTYCMQDGGEWQYPGNGSFDKNTISDALNASLSRVVTFFESKEDRMNRRFELPLEKTEGDGSWLGRNRVLYLADHEVHHRGKIVLALRQWGMTGIPFMPF